MSIFMNSQSAESQSKEGPQRKPFRFNPPKLLMREQRLSRPTDLLKAPGMWQQSWDGKLVS